MRHFKPNRIIAPVGAVSNRIITLVGAVCNCAVSVRFLTAPDPDESPMSREQVPTRRDARFLIPIYRGNGTGQDARGESVYLFLELTIIN